MNNRITSYTKLPTYEVSGKFLNIYWGETEHPPREDETEIYYSYHICRASIFDDYGTLITKIIRTQYTLDAEFAMINNGGEEYQTFLQFRSIAKELARGWLETKNN